MDDGRAKEGDPLEAVRKDVRAQIHRRKLMPAMVGLLCEILVNHLDTNDRGDQLIADGALVPGHVNYAPDPGVPEGD